MQLQTLTLTDFRLFAQARLDLPGRLVLLTGANASGKSTLLEAIVMLLTGRSPRARHSREVIRWDAAAVGDFPPLARIAAEGTAPDDRRISADLVVRRRATGTSIRRRINHRPVRVGSTGLWRVVLFASADLDLLTGPAATRRRYIDGMLTQSDAEYAAAWSRYQVVLRQRNVLLRHSAAGRHVTRGEFRFWNHELAQHGARLTHLRRQLTRELSPDLDELYRTLTGEPGLQLDYQPPPPYAVAGDEAAVLAALRAAMRETWPRERQAGRTLLGPHLDDIRLRLGAVDLGTYGSRGEQRTAALALKLAEAAYHQQVQGTPPLLLLDDVLAELDAQRRAFLQSWVLQTPGQVVLTTTTVADYAAVLRGQAAVYQLAAGAIGPLAEERPT